MVASLGGNDAGGILFRRTLRKRSARAVHRRDLIAHRVVKAGEKIEEVGSQDFAGSRNIAISHARMAAHNDPMARVNVSVVNSLPI
jgi:hypothetical protein